MEWLDEKCIAPETYHPNSETVGVDSKQRLLLRLMMCSVLKEACLCILYSISMEKEPTGHVLSCLLCFVALSYFIEKKHTGTKSN